MDRYTFSARLLHWLMAAGFVFMWICGYVMTSVVPDDSPAEEFLFPLHISIGVTLLALMVARIVVRFRNPPPPPLESLSQWEKTASHLGHLGLYLLPIAVIAIGWAETDFGGHGVKWFGIAMPKVFPTLEMLWGFQIEDIASTLHEWGAYAMLALAIIHVAAVIKHKWVDGHDVLYRMTLGKHSDD